MHSDVEIERRLPLILADILGLDVAELGPESRFFSEMGGESIEVLELQFRIEREFGLRVNFDKLLAGSAIRTDGAGHIEPEALRWLKSEFPFLRTENLGPQPAVEDLKSLMTVDAIVGFVKRAAAEAAMPPDGARASATAG